MKKRKKAKKKKVRAYIQGWGTYTNQTIVVVGMTHDQITGVMRRMKADPKIIAAWDKDKKENDERWLAGANNGCSWFHDGRSLVWFKDWKNNWEHWDTLVHELSHVIDQVLAVEKGMATETEGKAYQFEYLFRQIRRKLFQLYP